MSALFTLHGYLDREDVMWHIGEDWEANVLLGHHHYLGPLWAGAHLTICGSASGEVVAAMMWRYPTSRNLPCDGSWLELSRWCLTPGAGDNAGSRMHKWAVKIIRQHLPSVTTLVSYSDPGHGHTGALYRACNWQWAPTWHRLRTPPSGNGDWGTGPQEVKDRWVFCISKDPRRAEVLTVRDRAAVRYWRERASETELRWARTSLNLSEDVKALDRIPGDVPPVDLDTPPTEASDHPLGPVDLDRPAEHHREHVRRVSLAPRQLHAVNPSGDMP